MQTFTGFEYLLIDVANNHHSGLDKKTFEERLQWAHAHLDTLEAEAQNRIWKERPMYLKAVSAVRKAQQGEATGHLVGFDAVCSGMQIMSAMMGCESGARATGLIDQNRRADAYTDCSNIMSQRLGAPVENQRKKVKQAVMTSLYGSKKEPKKVFGEDTPELLAFYEAMYELCPGACQLLEMLLNSWNAGALEHSWVLPDGFVAMVKVMQQEETRIEVDELGHSTFTYQYYVNEGKEKDVKNAANVIHSIDAYILRSLIRRCNYDHAHLSALYPRMQEVLLARSVNALPDSEADCCTEEVAYYQEHYNNTGMVDAVILPFLDGDTIRALETEHLRKLTGLVAHMLEHKPFEIVTVHDDFKCHPNHMNHLRNHYRHILADLSESNTLDDVLSQLYGFADTVTRLSPQLGDTIRQANYALC